MRDWCKHKYGYVNFDDGYLYLTSTGNWSHTEDLSEFKEKTNRKSSSAEQYKTISYLGVAAILLICLLWWTGIRSLSFSAIIGVAWLGYSAYHYMSPGLTGEFKIPYSKIQSIEVKEKTLELIFTDFNGKAEKQIFEGLNETGLRLFSIIPYQDLSNLHAPSALHDDRHGESEKG